MWRAIRLVVDTGVHSQHWTRQQMVDYFHEHSTLDETNIQSEVDRYIAWPAQALGYKMGQLKILELRERAKTALGPKFDLKAFHDVVLDSGALPLDVLEKQVDAWIRARSRPEDGYSRRATVAMCPAPADSGPLPGNHVSVHAEFVVARIFRDRDDRFHGVAAFAQSLHEKIDIDHVWFLLGVYACRDPRHGNHAVILMRWTWLPARLVTSSRTSAPGSPCSRFRRRPWRDQLRRAFFPFAVLDDVEDLSVGHVFQCVRIR